ncbi:MAG TPA: hypothetical protein VGC96_08790 [Candidatus Elarobacter sp.]
METTTFLRGMELRALLEATAIVRLVDTFDQIIAEAEQKAATDVLAEHCAASWRRRRDALLTEHAALTSGWVSPAC